MSLNVPLFAENACHLFWLLSIPEDVMGIQQQKGIA
jgi:hypothetical protein